MQRQEFFEVERKIGKTSRSTFGTALRQWRQTASRQKQKMRNRRCSTLWPRLLRLSFFPKKLQFDRVSSARGRIAPFLNESANTPGHRRPRAIETKVKTNVFRFQRRWLLRHFKQRCRHSGNNWQSRELWRQAIHAEKISVIVCPLDAVRAERGLAPRIVLLTTVDAAPGPCVVGSRKRVAASRATKSFSSGAAETQG